jgi:hypothetical protein
LPESLARTSRLEFLTPVERLTLNHVRANSYVVVLALMEGLCSGLTSPGPFAQETAWFHAQFERGFGSRCEVVDRGSVPVALAPAEIGGATLAQLHLAWLAHIHDCEARLEAVVVDPGFRGLLQDRAARSLRDGPGLDDRLFDPAAAGDTPILAAQAVDAYVTYVAHAAAIIDRQVRHDVESLGRATGRAFTAFERETLLGAQAEASRRTFLGLVLRHPAFLRAVGRLGSAARAGVEEIAWDR